MTDESSEWLTFLEAYARDKPRPIIPDEFKIRLQYFVQSLHIGRPVEKVMIVMMGQSGTGKSATINNLFENENLCKTHPSKTTTHDVIEYGKLIDLSGMKAWLSLVDTPGTLDADGRDSDNMRTIANFRNNHPSFQPSLDRDGNERMVYPNIVLVTVDASEKRMEGSNSHFTQTLKIIKETNLLDFDRVNVIIVVTHCAYLGIDGEFIQNKQAKMNAIARVVNQVLGTTTVKIVFLENMPKKSRLIKQNDGDFYFLPDGELTPYNLYDAIRDQLRSNEDYLGSLVISRYFSTMCPERSEESKPLARFSVTVDGYNKTEILNHIMSPHIQFKLDTFSYRYLLRGYTPPIQSTRSCPIFRNPAMGNMNAVFETTNGIVASTQRGRHFFKMSCNTKEEYQSGWKTKVGLGRDMNLRLSSRIVAVGKWEENSEDSVLSFMYEIYVRKAKLCAQLSDFKMKCLSDDIDKLPNEEGWISWFLKVTDEKFDLFFDQWGTHYISKVMIGGSIRFDVIVNSECSDDDKNKIRDEINHQLQSLEEGRCGNITAKFDIAIVFSGGRPPSVSRLQDLTPERFSAWKRSISDHPVELEHTIKLTPYYDLILNPKKRAYFKKAVAMYLENYGIFGKRYSMRRNAEASKEETAARMFAVAWFSENIWNLLAAGAVVPILTSAAVAIAPATVAAACGAIIAKAFLK